MQSNKPRQPLRTRNEYQSNAIYHDTPQPWPLPPQMGRNVMLKQESKISATTASIKEKENEMPYANRTGYYDKPHALQQELVRKSSASNDLRTDRNTILQRSASNVSDTSSSPSFGTAQEDLQENEDIQSNQTQLDHWIADETNSLPPNFVEEQTNVVQSREEDERHHLLQRMRISQPRELVNLDKRRKQNMLRRPIASSQRDSLVLAESSELDDYLEERSKNRDSMPKTSIFEFSPETITLAEQPYAKRFGRQRTAGVVMRQQVYDSNVRGIRKAEAGVIVNRRERKPNALLQFDNPNPKSLHRSQFLSDDDDVITRGISKLFDNSDDEGHAERISMKNEKVISYGDGSFLPSGFILEDSSEAQDKSEDSNISVTVESSSGNAKPQNPKLRKGASAAFRRIEKNSDENDSIDIVTLGSVRDVVKRVSFICKTYLNCKVSIRDTGQKIRVESLDKSAKNFLRAWVLVTPHPSRNEYCTVLVKPGRNEGMQTGIGKLWNFYQSLAKNLQDIESTLK